MKETTIEYKTDTLQINRIDTVKVKVKNDTVYITLKEIETVIKTITNTVYEKCNDRTERIKARFDYKTERDSLRTIIEKQKIASREKIRTGQQEITKTKVERRNNNFWYLIIGLIIGFFISRKWLK